MIMIMVKLCIYIIIYISYQSSVSDVWIVNRKIAVATHWPTKEVRCVRLAWPSCQQSFEFEKAAFDVQASRQKPQPFQLDSGKWPFRWHPTVEFPRSTMAQRHQMFWTPATVSACFELWKKHTSQHLRLESASAFKFPSSWCAHRCTGHHMAIFSRVYSYI